MHMTPEQDLARLLADIAGSIFAQTWQQEATAFLAQHGPTIAAPYVAAARVVKSLEWQEFTGNRLGRRIEAAAIVGRYTVRADGAWFALWFGGSRIGGALPTEAAAKAAAQADYEARALSIFADPSPDLIGAAVAAARKEDAQTAMSFLVGEPSQGIPLRNPRPHEIAAKILALIPAPAEAALAAIVEAAVKAERERVLASIEAATEGPPRNFVALSRRLKSVISAIRKGGKI